MINFLVPKGLEQQASIRLRVNIISRLWACLNKKVDVKITNYPLPDAKLIIINKFFPHFFSEKILSGKQYIIDLCDPHWCTSSCFFSEDFLQKASQIIFSSDKLKRGFANYYSHLELPTEQLAVIEDTCAIDGRLQPRRTIIDHVNLIRLRKHLSKAKLKKKLTVLWYGNFGSEGRGGVEDFVKLKKLVDEFGGSHQMAFFISSEKIKTTRYIREKLDCSNITVFQWTAAFHFYSICLFDVIVLPVSLNEITNGKSVNRLSDAVASNAIVLASKVPSYQEFAQKFRCGVHLSDEFHEMNQQLQSILKSGMQKSNFDSTAYNNAVAEAFYYLVTTAK